MGRPLGSKDKKPRKKARSPYRAYGGWYKKYTKGYKAGWYSPKMTKAEFEVEYDLARKAGIKNPARSIAASQEYVDRKFERQYKKLYGRELGDIRNKADREKIFMDFVGKLMEDGMSMDEARDEFENYFY